MQRLNELAIEKAKALLESGEVQRVIGWKKGEMGYDLEPSVFYSVEDLANFVYNGFAGANLSKYLIEESKKEGKVLIFLKPCDSYSFNQLVKEHRINKANVYTVGIECQGKVDVRKLKENGIEVVDGIVEDIDEVTIISLGKEYKFVKEEVLLGKCSVCEKQLLSYDEVISLHDKRAPKLDRFELVKKLEGMTADERFAFWKKELSKCIRCNACRNVCPACSCRKCVFDSTKFDADRKANVDPFEESMFHIIRAFHVAGRCTDCGECSRVCPQGIPLHLFNRKFIKDINEFYGEYQAGAEVDERSPLTNFTFDDLEPGERR